MKVFLPTALYKGTGKVCTDPAGAYDTFPAALYALRE